jgi:hypothetical protein
MPKQYRKTLDDMTLLWIPEYEERGLLSYQFWRSEVRVQDFGPRMRCVPRSDKVMAGRYLFFVRRSDLDAIFPPSTPEAEPTTARVLAIVWTTRIAERLKADGAIPDDISQVKFAEMLAQRMHEEAAADPSLGKTPSARYIRNHLKEWLLWPPKLIKPI